MINKKAKTTKKNVVFKANKATNGKAEGRR